MGGAFNVDGFKALQTLLDLRSSNVPESTSLVGFWANRNWVYSWLTLCVWEENIKENIWPTKEANDIWRIKTNKELDELIKHRNIINYVKAQRLSWFGHTNRMPETSIVKRIHKWKPFTGRPAGSPKSRWEDDVSNDLKKMKLINWAEQVQDRLKWTLSEL